MTQVIFFFRFSSEDIIITLKYYKLFFLYMPQKYAINW